MTIPERIKTDLLFQIVVQLALLLLASTILDGGAIMRVVALGSLGFWLGIFFILLRRSEPSTSDVQFIRFGFWIFIVITVALAILLRRVF